MDFSIRPVAIQDIPAVNDIYNHAVVESTATFQIEPATIDERREWFDAHQNALYPAFVAETADGEIAGWGALSKYASRCAWMFTVEDSIYIAPEYHRRGIGNALLERLIEAATQAGHHTIIAQISDNNTASIRLHERHGFSLVGVLREVGHKFDRWLDITIMQKIIA